MNFSTLDDVLQHEIEDLYSAEMQLIEALGKMAEGATTDVLQTAFENHIEQTQEHVQRLQEIADILGIDLPGEMCRGMEGLIAEGSKLLAETPSTILDVALISAAQRIEHYEIAGYGTVATLAEALGQSEVVDLLTETLDEEKETDEQLTEISESLMSES